MAQLGNFVFITHVFKPGPRLDVPFLKNRLMVRMSVSHCSGSPLSLEPLPEELLCSTRGQAGTGTLSRAQV